MHSMESKPGLKVLLSEEARIKRNRQFVVNIQMTVISWSLEFITGAFVLSILTMREYGVYFGPALILPDVCVSFIVIPAYYLFNNEVNRSLIAMEGWCRWINRLAFPHRQYQPHHPMELASMSPKNLGSFGNGPARAQHNSRDSHSNSGNPFSGCITEEMNSNIKQRKPIPARSQPKLSETPRLESPPQLVAVQCQHVQNDEDIETIALDYLTVADMLNADRISTVPENNWM